MTPVASRRVWLSTIVLGLLALLTFTSIPGAWPTPAGVLGTALLICCSEIAAVRAGLGNQGWSISLTETVIAASLMLHPGPWIILAVALGMGGAYTARRGKSAQKIAFNVAMHSFTTAVAVLVSTALGSGPVAVTTAMGLFWVGNVLSVGRVVSWASNRTMWSLLQGHLGHSALASASNTALGVVAATLVPHSIAHLLLLVPPIALLMWAYAMVWRQHDATGLLEQIVTSQDAVRAATPFGIATSLIGASRGTLGASQAVTVILEDGRPSVAYEMPPGLGEAVVPVHSAVSTLSTWWAQAALSRPDPVAYGVRGNISWLTLRVGPRQRPMAILFIGRDLATRGAVTRSEQRIAGQLLEQAAIWVRAMRDAGDSASLPACVSSAQARQSISDLSLAAERLVEVAKSRGTRVDDVLTELHRVEHAVASLLTTAGRT